jgi:putative oxidoreductase
MLTKSNLDIALLLIRVGLASVFIAHGWDKISDMDATVNFFLSLKLSAFWAYSVAYIEIIGGFSMILGVFTGWSGLLLAADMIGAIALVKINKGFLYGYEFDLVLFLSALAISLAGPGKYTLLERFDKK